MTTFLAPPPRRVELPRPAGGADVLFLHFQPGLTSALAMARGRKAAEKELGRPLPQDDELVELFTRAEVIAASAKKEDGTAFYLSSQDVLARAGQDTITFMTLEYNRLRAEASPMKGGLSAADFERLLVEMGAAEEGSAAVPFWNQLDPAMQWTCAHTMARLLLLSRIDSFTSTSPGAPGGGSA